jgi:hypothetical protein
MSAQLGVASRGVAMRPAARGLPRMTPVVRVAGGRNFNLKVRPMPRAKRGARSRNSNTPPSPLSLFLWPPAPPIALSRAAAMCLAAATAAGSARGLDRRPAGGARRPGARMDGEREGKKGGLD